MLRQVYLQEHLKKVLHVLYVVLSTIHFLHLLKMEKWPTKEELEKMRKEKDKAFVLLETESAKASSLNDSLNELKEKYKNDLKILSETLSSESTLNSVKETLLNEKQTLSRLVEDSM